MAVIESDIILYHNSGYPEEVGPDWTFGKDMYNCRSLIKVLYVSALVKVFLEVLLVIFELSIIDLVRGAFTTETLRLLSLNDS